MRVLLFVLLSLPCFAQLQTIEIRVSGLNCESCSGAVSTRFKKLRGVESATFDGERGVASVKFTRENEVSLDVVRDTLKNLGYTPGDATVSLLGTLRTEADRVLVSLPHQVDAFTLTGSGTLSDQGAVPITGLVKAGTTHIFLAQPSKRD